MKLPSRIYYGIQEHEIDLDKSREKEYKDTFMATSI